MGSPRVSGAGCKIRRSLEHGPATADPRLLEAGSEREGAQEVNLMEDFSRNDND